MRLSSFIALRYLRSPKSHSVINLITWVAGAALATPTAALIIILSLHNGLSDSIKEMFNAFDPQLRISAKEGKYFDPELVELDGIEGIAAYSRVIEDNVLLRKGEREHLAVLKGVDLNYAKVVRISDLITHGKFELRLGDLYQAVVGQGIAYNLGVSVSLMEAIEIYSILPERGNSLLPTPVFRSKEILPVGVYALDSQSDNYIIVPLDFAQQVLSFGGKISSVEILLKNGSTPQAVKSELQAKLGDSFRVETRYEQKASMYKAINQEKWIIYLLLMMVFVIAALSLVGSIIILIADKGSHIATFRSMGADTKLIRRIFQREGMLIVLIGSLAGFVLGATFALVQQHYGLIKMVGETMQMESYPVRVVLSDILVIMGGVWLVGLGLSWVTTRAAIK